MLTRSQLDDMNRQVLRFVRQLPEPGDAVNVLASALASLLAAQYYDEPGRIERALDQLRAATLDAAAQNRASPTALVLTLGERRGKLAPEPARVYLGDVDTTLGAGGDDAGGDGGDQGGNGAA